MIDLEAVRKRWLKERERYEEFGRLVAKRIGAEVQRRGIWCDTSSRAKEPHSLIKKLLKGKHTYETLPDKVGARCVVRYLDDLEEVVTIAGALFEFADIDRKLEQLGTERVGYGSTHVEVRLRADDPDVVHYAGFSVELQIKTLGQHLWSEMSHDSVYKNDDMLAVLQQIGEVRRDDIHTQQLGFGEHHAAVDDDDVIAIAQRHDVHSELAESA